MASIRIINPDGFESVFNYNLVLKGGEPEALTVKNAEGYPWEVKIETARNNVHLIPQVYSFANEEAQEKTMQLEMTIAGNDQIELSKELLRGRSLPPDLSYEPLINKYPQWSTEVQSEWEKSLQEKRIQKGKHTFRFVDSKNVVILANSIKFIEPTWKVRRLKGMAQWGERRYGVRWLAEEPQIINLEESVVSLETEEKVPYRFKQHIKDSNQQGLMINLAPRFCCPPAIRLDGANDFARADAVCGAIKGSALSFGCWANPAESSNPDGTLIAFNTSTGGNCNMIGYDAVKKQYFYFDPLNSYRWSGGHFKFDRWHHVFMTIDEKNQGTLYLNGEPMIRFGSDIRPDPKGRFSIGQEWDLDESSDFFKGQIADVRVWNQHFSAAAVRTQMKKRLSGQEKGLVAYFPIGEEKGQLLQDLANANHAELVGGQWSLDTSLPID